jgi:hypothetical protein
MQLMLEQCFAITHHLDFTLKYCHSCNYAMCYVVRKAVLELGVSEQSKSALADVAGN